MCARQQFLRRLVQRDENCRRRRRSEIPALHISDYANNIERKILSSRHESQWRSEYWLIPKKQADKLFVDYSGRQDSRSIRLLEVSSLAQRDTKDLEVIGYDI